MSKKEKLIEVRNILKSAKADDRVLTVEEASKVEKLLEESKEVKQEPSASVEKQEPIENSIQEESIVEVKQAIIRKVEPDVIKTETSSITTHDNILDDSKRGFKNFADFAMSVQNSMTPGRMADDRLRIQAATGMSQDVAANGGYLVPPTFSSTIWDGMNSMPDNLLNRTDSYTVQGESLTFPANAETSRAAGSRYGGIRGYWLNEAGQVTASKPTFRQVKIEPQQLGVLCYVTDKLLNNSSVALEQYLTRAASDEINFLIGDAIINGSGAGQPKGIVNSAARVSVSKEAGQAAASVVLANIVKMWARCHAKSRANSVWLINQDVEPQLQQLSIAVGVGGMPAYLPPGGISEAPYARLMGRPVLPIEWCATVGTEGDIILADLKSYVTGVKGGIEAASSIHLKFDYAETAFRFLFAVDGQPWMAAPITPYKGTSNTQSAFVTLAVRA